MALLNRAETVQSVASRGVRVCTREDVATVARPRQRGSSAFAGPRLPHLPAPRAVLLAAPPLEAPAEGPEEGRLTPARVPSTPARMMPRVRDSVLCYLRALGCWEATVPAPLQREQTVVRAPPQPLHVPGPLPM